MKLNWPWKRQQEQEPLPVKVSSVSYRDLIELWINQTLTKGCHVVLYDVNLLNKTTDFWLKMPRYYSVKFSDE